MATNPVFCAIVPEVLTEENYATWSVCIQNYLLSQDLWDIIEKESTRRGLEWRKKNATALHAIQISCGSKLLHHIMEYKSAKEAWYFLASKCSPQIQGDIKLASSSSVQGKELVDQASHRLNSALRRLKFLNEYWMSITEAEEKKAITNESQTRKRIRKVPPQLQTENFMTCYEPSVVSIGPYHHNCDRRLQQVEELKDLIAEQFVDQLTDSKNIDEFFSQFKKEFHLGIKDLYDENVTEDIHEEEFKWMMFLDGCFVLYFIFSIHFNVVETMGLQNHHIALVQQDLFLVDNQLPFQVLMMLLSLSAFSAYGMCMLDDFIEECGRSIWIRYEEVRIEESLHLLDFLWIKLLGNYEESNDEVEWPHGNKYLDNKRHLFHGVKELTAAGIHIRPTSPGSLRDIKFKSHGIYGTITLPCMTIERSTRQMFLNLIAYEAYLVHTYNLKKSWFTSYICFLDLLIDHVEDVKALRTAGILENYLDSDEEVAKLFNEIASELLPRVDTYREVKFKIQLYLSDKRKVKMASWVAEVIHDHFKSPWTIIALFAGIIVISLTFVQTYFTIFPRSN